MRLRTVFLLGCLAPLAGCHLSRNVARNAYNEPAEIRDELSVDRQLRREGAAAFAEVVRQYSRRSFCDDFRDGFIDGYSDYLDRGGKADMPAVPPLKYRRAKYLNPDGHAKIKDYFLGFKYGMDVAIATGCRPFYTVPVLLPESNELPPLNITVLPAPPDANAPMPKLGSPLPLPKAAPATPGLGNPVVPKPTESGTVPIPSGIIPKPIPMPAPPGPGGKSASAVSPGILVPASAIDIPAIPSATSESAVPPPRPPVFDLPEARPFR